MYDRLDPSMIPLARFLAPWIVAGCGCSLLTAIDGLSGGPTSDAGPSEAGPSDVEVESAVDGGDAGHDVEAGDCPSKGGPMTRVDRDGQRYCIDRTEVTRKAYLAFLADVPKSTHPRCAWKSGYSPTDSWPPSAGVTDFPVVGVDWCDAHAFCAWAGKKLCGQLRQGSPLSLDSAKEVSQSMIVHACSEGGRRLYAYGNAYDGGACNDFEHSGGNLVAVGSMPTCEGGYPGIFDLVGNVAEWIDACAGDAGDGAADICGVHNSGATEEQSPELVCAYVRRLPRETRHAFYGFRCCAP